MDYRIAVMSCTKCGLMKKTGCRIESGMTSVKVGVTPAQSWDRLNKESPGSRLAGTGA